MSPKRKRTREEIHADLMRSDESYRRLAERIDARRTPEERARLPLGSEAFSDEVTRQLERRVARGTQARRRASS